MLKRVNFTGRRRVPRDRVHIDVHDGSPRTFQASINLDGLKFLPHAAVFLEAMCAGSNVVERFDFGEVERLDCSQVHPLVEIEGENVFFALKVVDRAERFGRILGIAENIRPVSAGKQTASGRRGILPIEPYDLGEELWRLEFREHDVFLLVNKEIPGLVDRMRRDPQFYAVIYPEVVRRILIEAFREGADPEDDEELWPVLWLRFGRNLHPANERPPMDDDDQQTGWIEEVVRAFCDAHHLRTRFAAACGNGGES